MSRPAPGASVAVLGAGIMGCSLALFLARRGFAVSLFDLAEAPMMGASRWNEGKIHLGYLYAADPGLGTARRLLPGGLEFAPLLAELAGGPVDAAVTPGDDIFLCHRRSVAGAEAMARYFDAVSDLVRQAPGAERYLADAGDARARRLSSAELEAIADPERVEAGFAVPERSIMTVPVADALAGAVAAEPRISLRMGARVVSARPAGAPDGPWKVGTEGAGEAAFDLVINALWHGRLAVDATAGLAPEGRWTHRYRVSAFLRTARPWTLPSAVVAAGPFGDVKNYDGREFYLSWYPAGLLAEGDAVAPPEVPQLDDADRSRILGDIRAGLGEVIPGVRAVIDDAQTVSVEGGYVFAQGFGSLADAAATLHRRDAFGVRRLGRYLSVDTGKYSTAPLMARDLARQIAEG